MSERKRMEEWMGEKGFSVTTLAEAIGDSYANLYVMLVGKRKFSAAFKWRFLLAFGYAEAASVFVEIATDKASV